MWYDVFYAIKHHVAVTNNGARMRRKKQIKVKV